MNKTSPPAKITFYDWPSWSRTTLSAARTHQKKTQSILLDNHGFFVCSNDLYETELTGEDVTHVAITVAADQCHVIELNRSIAFLILSRCRHTSDRRVKKQSELLHNLSTCTDPIISYGLLTSAMDEPGTPVTLALTVNESASAEAVYNWLQEFIIHERSRQLTCVVIAPAEDLTALPSASRLRSLEPHAISKRNLPLQLFSLGFLTDDKSNESANPNEAESLTLKDAISDALTPFPHKLKRWSTERQHAAAQGEDSDSAKLTNDFISLTKVLFPAIWNGLLDHAATSTDNWESLSQPRFFQGLSDNIDKLSVEPLHSEQYLKNENTLLYEYLDSYDDQFFTSDGDLYNWYKLVLYHCIALTRTFADQKKSAPALTSEHAQSDTALEFNQLIRSVIPLLDVTRDDSAFFHPPTLLRVDRALERHHKHIRKSRFDTLFSCLIHEPFRSEQMAEQAQAGSAHPAATSFEVLAAQLSQTVSDFNAALIRILASLYAEQFTEQLHTALRAIVNEVTTPAFPHDWKSANHLTVHSTTVDQVITRFRSKLLSGITTPEVDKTTNFDAAIRRHLNQDHLRQDWENDINATLKTLKEKLDNQKENVIKDSRNRKDNTHASIDRAIDGLIRQYVDQYLPDKHRCDGALSCSEQSRITFSPVHARVQHALGDDHQSEAASPLWNPDAQLTDPALLEFISMLQEYRQRIIFYEQSLPAIRDACIAGRMDDLADYLDRIAVHMNPQVTTEKINLSDDFTFANTGDHDDVPVDAAIDVQLDDDATEQEKINSGLTFDHGALNPVLGLTQSTPRPAALPSSCTYPVKPEELPAKVSVIDLRYQLLNYLAQCPDFLTRIRMLSGAEKSCVLRFAEDGTSQSTRKDDLTLTELKDSAHFAHLFENDRLVYFRYRLLAGAAREGDSASPANYRSQPYLTSDVFDTELQKPTMKLNEPYDLYSEMQNQLCNAQRVFICYPTRDGTTIARRIEGELKRYAQNNKELNISVFVDSQLDNGDKWMTQLGMMIDIATVFIIIVTRASLTQQIYKKNWIKHSEAKKITHRLVKALSPQNNPAVRRPAVRFVVLDEQNADDQALVKNAYGELLAQRFLEEQQKRIRPDSRVLTNDDEGVTVFDRTRARTSVEVFTEKELNKLFKNDTSADEPGNTAKQQMSWQLHNETWILQPTYSSPREKESK